MLMVTVALRCLSLSNATQASRTEMGGRAGFRIKKSSSEFGVLPNFVPPPLAPRAPAAAAALLPPARDATSDDDWNHGRIFRVGRPPPCVTGKSRETLTRRRRGRSYRIYCIDRRGRLRRRFASSFYSQSTHKLYSSILSYRASYRSSENERGARRTNKYFVRASGVQVSLTRA